MTEQPLTERAVPEWRTVYLPRLLAKRQIEPATGCWNWTGAHMPKGYGHIKFEGRYEKVYRLSYILHKGPIAPGLMVCHACDNPRCFNPAHLWLGTAADNARDAKDKGRLRNGVSKGEKNGSAKLSAAAVEAIRNSPKVYGSGKRLAAEYGVKPERIYNIRAGRTWRGA